MRHFGEINRAQKKLSFEKIKFHDIPSIGTVMRRLKSRHTFQDLLSLITRVERPIYTDHNKPSFKTWKKKKKKGNQRRDLASLFIPVKHSSRNIAYLNNKDIAQKITIFKENDFRIQNWRTT